MPETWGLGQLVAFVGVTSEERTRLGRLLVLFGLLSFVGGAGVLAVTEVIQLATAVRFTVREFAGVIVGIGLPVFLYGLVVLTEGEEQAVYVSSIGTALCALAVFAFFLTYPEQWVAAETPAYVTVVLVIYGLGVMTCSFAAGMAVLARLNAVDEPDLSPDETGFIWGDPPES